MIQLPHALKSRNVQIALVGAAALAWWIWRKPAAAATPASAGVASAGWQPIVHSRDKPPKAPKVRHTGHGKRTT